MRTLVPQQILSGAWRLAWTLRREWFDRALMPLVWLLALDLLLLPDPTRMAAVTAGAPQGGEVMGLFLSVLLYFVLSLAIWSMFAAAWLRFCLNAGAAPGLAGLSWSRSESGVLGAAVRLVLLLFAGFTVIMVLFGSGALSHGINMSSAVSLLFLAVLAMAPILSRASLILPAAATGQPARLVDSWRLTRGNGLRLCFMLAALVVLGYFAYFLVGATASSLLGGVFGAPLSLGPRVVMILIVNLASLACSALVLAALALIYRQLGGGPGLQVVPQERDIA